MADEQNELKRINWTELLGFTQIFKSFKMSIHLSKLALALTMIVLLFVVGWVMSFAWGVVGYTAMPGEVFGYYASTPERFEREAEKWEAARLTNSAGLLADARSERFNLGKFKSHFKNSPDTSRARIERVNVHFLKGAFNVEAMKLRSKEAPKTNAQDIYDAAVKDDDDYDDLIDEAREENDDEIEKIQDALEDAYSTADKAIDDDKTLSEDKNEDLQDIAYDILDADYVAAKKAISLRRKDHATDIKAIEGEGIFTSFIDYESDCIVNAMKAVRYGNIFTGLQAHRTRMQNKDIAAINSNIPSGVPAARSSNNDPQGFVVYVLLAISGICWMVSNHLVFAIIYLLLALAAFAVFGGAIARISALEFARDERISIKQALKFSISKFPSFFSAPLIPLVLILGAGLLMFLGGLVGSIPYVGTMIMAILFFLALLLGLGVAFLLVGLLAGGSLMYPTIAVEGSDSFDGMGRSFGYIYGKPWHTALYSLVAIVYGAITYLFVRFFVYLALVATHTMVKWGMIGGGSSLSPRADAIDVLWTKPTFDNLFGNLSWGAMGGYDKILAFIIGMWVFLLASAVTAYLISYAISSSTTIYFLLRRKVDATDLDDVYVEEEEDQELSSMLEEETQEAVKEDDDTQAQVPEETPETPESDSDNGDE